MWKLKARQRYVLVQEDGENPLRHRGTFFISPRHVKHHSTRQFVEFSYASAPKFASQKNCKAFAQNSHCAVEVYDKYAILFDPDYTRKVAVELWTPQVETASGWETIQLSSAVFSGERLSDGVKITRRNDVLKGGSKVGELEISWILRVGAYLKHEVKLTNLSGSQQNLRMIQGLVGIAGKRVIHALGEDDVTVTMKEKLSLFVRFVDEDNPRFQYLDENLLSLGHWEGNAETGEPEWVSDHLRGIRFKLVDYEGKQVVRCDIVIGNYTLSENESLLIDPDTSTWQVGVSSDDCRMYDSSFSNTATVVDAGNWYYSGVDHTLNSFARWTGITIPQGATISSAYFQVDAFTLDGTALTKIYGIDEDNTATFDSDPTGRPLTTACVDWDPTPGSWTQGYWYDSPDISAIIQEIVDRAGWVSGNALGLKWADDGSATGAANRAAGYSYDYGVPADAPKLEVTWTSVTTYTKTYATDVLFKKLGVTKTAVVDAAFKKADIVKTYVMDTLFSKTFEKPINLDVLIKKIGVTKTTSVDALFKKLGITEPFAIDINLQKTLQIERQTDALFRKTLTVQRQVDTLFQKLDVLKQFGVDVDFLKQDVIKSFAIDTCFGAVVTYTIQKQINVLFKKLGITKVFTVDVDFQKTLQVQRQIDVFLQKTTVLSRQIDVLFKKSGVLRIFNINVALQKADIPKTFTLDALIKATETLTLQVDVLLQKSVTTQKQINVVFKKFGIPKTFAVDAYFGTAPAPFYGVLTMKQLLNYLDLKTLRTILRLKEEA